MAPIQLVGQTSSTITPAASGDYVRAYLWRSSNSVPVRVGAAVVTFERLYSLFLMVAVSVLLILFPRHGVIGWILRRPRTRPRHVRAAAVRAACPPASSAGCSPSSARGGSWVASQEGATVMVDQFRKLMKAPLLLAVDVGVDARQSSSRCGAQLWLVMLSLAHRVPITQAVAAQLDLAGGRNHLHPALRHRFAGRDPGHGLRGLRRDGVARGLGRGADARHHDDLRRRSRAWRRT